MTVSKNPTSLKLSMDVENGTNALGAMQTKSDGAKKTLSIADPREDVTLAEAQAAAAKIIEAGVLTSGGLGLNEFVEAHIKVVTVSVLA